jgi:hypothetical protein
MIHVYVWFSHEHCQFPNYLLVFNLGILEYHIEILGEKTLKMRNVGQKCQGWSLNEPIKIHLRVLPCYKS